MSQNDRESLQLQVCWGSFPQLWKGMISLGISRGSSVSGKLWVGRKILKAGQNMDYWMPHVFLDLGQEPQGRCMDSRLSRSLLGQPQSLCLSSSHGTAGINCSHPSLVHCLLWQGLQLGPASVSPALPWGRKKEASWKFRKGKAKKEPTIGPN